MRDVYMKISQEEYVFLIKSVLGRELNFSNDIQIDTIISACIAKADRDMLTAGCNYLQKGKKDERRLKMAEILKTYSYEFSRRMISDFSKEIGKEMREPEFLECAYGLAQKEVNMCYKYIYVLRRFIKDISCDFSRCDCPVDSVILDELGLKTVWSRLTPIEYANIQNAINTRLMDAKFKPIVDKYNGELGRMVFDFAIW